jgi:hypothetical protein
MLAATAGSNTSSRPICGKRSIEIRPRRGARNPNCHTNRQAPMPSSITHQEGNSAPRSKANSKAPPATQASNTE